MRNTIETMVLLLIVAALIYFERGQLNFAYRSLVNRYAPCSSPITYSIGSFDNRFGISQADFKEAIGEAEGIWEKAAGKQLFAYSAKGELSINLVYDSRQEATMKLQKLGLVVKDDRASYDTLKAKYDSMEAAYQSQKSSYEAAVAAYEKKRDAYNALVQSWNEKGGAPKSVYAQLQAEKNELNAQADALNQREASLNEQVDTINALVEELNRLATALNITASQFNQIGANRTEEFTEGEYVNGSDGEKIDIYQFDSHEKLVRVLTHELGHALMLDHNDDPKAIMYKLNQGNTLTLAPADIAELKARCALK